MAKKKVQKVLTDEERLAIEKAKCLGELNEVVKFLSEPTYHFKVGDNVSYGAMKSSVVEEVLENGKAYLLCCVAVENNYGNPYEHKVYRCVAWTDVRPVRQGTTSFTHNQELRLNFYNTNIESLIHRHYHFGVDFEPDYQRDFVWSQEDKEYLIDSVFNNIDIGKFMFIHLSNEEWHKRGFSYEILDGKQRLSTLIDFYENRFPYKGKFYNDLSGEDKRTFINHHVTYADVNEADKKTIYKYFLMLNRTGKVMTKEQLDKVEALYNASPLS